MNRKFFLSLPIAVSLALGSMAPAQASTLTNGTWQTQGPGKLAATQTAQGGEDFTYNDNGDQNWYYQMRNWTFSSVATDTETLKFNWVYHGLHAWYMAQDSAIAFADGPNGRTTVTLQPLSYNSGGWTVSGTAQLQIYKGYDYGFVTSGRNFDGTWLLNGSLTINPADTTPPVTTASTNIQPNSYGWFNQNVTVALNATDDTAVASTQYSLDGGNTWTAYTAPLVLSQ